MNYILEGKTPVIEPDVLKWATWYQTANRRVRQDTATVRVDGEKVGEVRVSTIFLGIDHAFDGGPPMLFETMIFGGPCDQEQDRCATWEAAEKMHEKMMERVRSGKPERHQA